MNNRGDIASLLVMIGIVFALAVGGLLFSFVFNQFTDQFRAMPEISNSSMALNAVDTAAQGSITYMDLIFLFGLIAFAVGMIISSIYIDASPGITMVFIIIMIIAIFLAGMFANVYAEITSVSELSTFAEQFVLMKTIMPILPFIVLGIGVLTIIILYGKPQKVV